MLFAGLLLLVVLTCAYLRNMALSGIFLEQSTRFLADSTATYLLIPVYLMLTMLYLLFNLTLQWVIVTSSSAAEPHPEDVWTKWRGNKALQIIHFILFLWGLQFLKDSCRYLLTQSTTLSVAMPSSGTLLTAPLAAPLCYDASSGVTSEASWRVPFTTCSLGPLLFLRTS